MRCISNRILFEHVPKVFLGVCLEPLLVLLRRDVQLGVVRVLEAAQVQARVAAPIGHRSPRDQCHRNQKECWDSWNWGVTKDKFVHCEASTQSRCFVFFWKFWLPMGLHSRCSISQTTVEHVKNALQNITTEGTPHSVLRHSQSMTLSWPFYHHPDWLQWASVHATPFVFSCHDSWNRILEQDLNQWFD